jgi:hypothetical protein
MEQMDRHGGAVFVETKSLAFSPVFIFLWNDV